LNSGLPKKIGLIAGGTSYPVLLAKEAVKKGNDIYTVAVEGLALKEIENFSRTTCWIEFGEFIALIEFFKKNDIKYVIMAGNVKKADIFKGIKPDFLTAKILKAAGGKSDMNLLDIIAAELKKRGIELIDARTFLEDYIPKKGCLTERAPTVREWEDILFGWKLAKLNSSFDVGLTVAVKEKVVLAIEAIEGTDKAIKRAGEYGQGGFVVVKVARPKQDMRFELPVVGLETVKLLKQVKAKVLAIEAEKTLFFDIKKAIKEANKSKIAVVSL